MAKRSLVPETGGLRVVAIRWARGGLVIEVEPRQPPQCPRCGAISTSRHSAYIRLLRDLPIQGDAVTLRVHAGRWRCRSSSCVQRTFVAPLAASAHARRRRTRRLDNLAFLIGHAMGGRPAERLARRLGMPLSRDVILTNSRRAASWNAASGPTRVIVIDEWSRRKGSDFGSIIVDLERRQAIEVLPDRVASSVEAWMRNHPDIEHVVRDRAATASMPKAPPKECLWRGRWPTASISSKTFARRSRPNWLESRRRPALAAIHRPSLPSLARTAVHARVWQGGTCAS